MKYLSPLLVLFLGSLLLTGCGEQKKQQAAKKEMLIYCGITMVKPIKELASRFEKSHNCDITINQGGSEDLYQSLKFSKIGELYLPGSSSYRKKHMADGFLTDYIYVGYNQAALIVQKGNPKNIPADITLLADRKYATVIANPESCSIGKQSKKILSQKGLFNSVMDNAILIAADSRAMNKSIIDKSADLILNWGATAHFENNKEYMEKLSLDPAVAPKKGLFINLLSFARYPQLAREFMQYAASREGQEVFHNYGFLDEISAPGVIQQ